MSINKITRDDIEQFRADIGWHHSSAAQPCNAVDAYQSIATKSAIYPGQGTPLGLAYVALKLNGESGEVAEHVGKAMRDDNLISERRYRAKALDDNGKYDPTQTREAVVPHLYSPLTPERRAAIIKEAGDVLWYLSALANELGMPLSEIMITNLEKLCDRTERDALRGSGDDR